MTEDTKKAARELTSSERNELMRIVKARFKLLRAQTKARISDIVAAERRQVEAEKKELCDKYRERIAPLFEEWQRIGRELEDISREAQADDLYVSGNAVTPHTRYDRGGMWDVDVRTQLVITEIDRAELAVLEEILTCELQSAAAQAFLARIPTVETLVEQGTRSLEPAAA